MQRSDRNFSRCVNARPTGTRRTANEGGAPAARACVTASSAIRATPVLSGCSMYGRKRETPSGAKPRQWPCRSAAMSSAKISRLSDSACSPCSRRRYTGTAPEPRMNQFMIGIFHSVSLAQKRTTRGVLRMSTIGSARPLPWLKHTIIALPGGGTCSSPCVSVVE